MSTISRDSTSYPVRNISGSYALCDGAYSKPHAACQNSEIGKNNKKERKGRVEKILGCSMTREGTFKIEDRDLQLMG